MKLQARTIASRIACLYAGEVVVAVFSAQVRLHRTAGVRGPLEPDDRARALGRCLRAALLRRPIALLRWCGAERRAWLGSATAVR